MRIIGWDIPDEAVLAGVGALGAFGRSGFDWLRSLSKAKDDEEASLRAEYRGDIAVLRKEINDLKVEVKEWRERSYVALQDNLRIRAEFDMQRLRVSALETELAEVRSQAEERAATITALQTELAELRERAERRTGPRRQADRDLLAAAGTIVAAAEQAAQASKEIAGD